MPVSHGIDMLFASTRRHPLRVTLLVFVLTILVATVGTIAAAAYFNFVATLDRLGSSLFSEVGRGTADKVRGIFEPVDDMLFECQTLAKRGLLPIDNPDEMAARLVERFRYQERIDWLSFSDE